MSRKFGLRGKQDFFLAQRVSHQKSKNRGGESQKAEKAAKHSFFDPTDRRQFLNLTHLLEVSSSLAAGRTLPHPGPQRHLFSSQHLFQPARAEVFKRSPAWSGPTPGICLGATLPRSKVSEVVCLSDGADRARLASRRREGSDWPPARKVARTKKNLTVSPNGCQKAERELKPQHHASQ